MKRGNLLKATLILLGVIIGLFALSQIYFYKLYKNRGFSLLSEATIKAPFGRITCTRKSPKIEGLWTPSKQQIYKLEQELEQLKNLKSERGSIFGPVTGYYRQYLGIISNDQEIIYINASRNNYMSDQNNVPREDWLDDNVGLTIMCDGGGDYWGAEYNPATNTFSSLEIDGTFLDN